MRFPVAAASLLALLPASCSFQAQTRTFASFLARSKPLQPSRTAFFEPLSVSRSEVDDVVQVARDDDDDDDDTNSSEQWWQSYQLPNADLAEETRSDFKILSRRVDGDKPLVYLDSAATSQKPHEVMETLMYYYEFQNSNVHRGAHTLSREATSAYEDARDAVCQFVQANSRNEIVFTSGATEAINLVAYSYGRPNLGVGDEIVLTEMEHHSNLVPWQILAEETGAVLKFVKVDQSTGMLDLEQFESLLNERTKLVTFQHVSNVMACVNPVADMAKTVRSKAPDAKILLDACQSVGKMKVNVQELGVDFLVASGHKMCGPTGIGFLWATENLLNSMPPFLGGGEMIDHVTLEKSTFSLAPGRFEAGTPAIAQAIGLGAAVKYLNKLGMDRIEAYEHELGEYLHRRLSEVKGVTILGPTSDDRRAALCAFVCDAVHPSDLSTFLDMEGVAIRAGHHCCQPLHQALGYSHSARASLYFYNTKEDVDAFIEHLQNTLEFFGNMGSAANGERGDVDDDFVPFI